jgi:hypothetical protein
VSDGVILSINGGKAVDTAALLKHGSALPAGNSLKIAVSRAQDETVLQLIP